MTPINPNRIPVSDGPPPPTFKPEGEPEKPYRSAWRRYPDKRVPAAVKEPEDVPAHCGRRMVLRINRRTGQGFYGCWNRECKHTEPANVREPDWFGKNKQPKREETTR